EDAITAVPASYREASYALGANGWQTSWRVVLPAAGPGIFAAVVLGVGRVVGETMAVLMVTGNAAVIPHTLLEPVRTMTATIAAEMGETVQGSQHFHALFLVGAVLFAMTLALNFGAAWLLARSRRKAGGRA
ncbi:MAG TPA: ABC transporter permease subunit, partial [Planctomycetota bacterium]|nr:ABC transporter permease subunit [Planctomycetota bacterium]